MYMYVLGPFHVALSPNLLWNFFRMVSLLHLYLGVILNNDCHLKDMCLLLVLGVVRHGMALCVRFKKKLKGHCELVSNLGGEELSVCCPIFSIFEICQHIKFKNMLHLSKREVERRALDNSGS